MYIHGNNIEQKENHRTKYQDRLSKTYLKEIRQKYDRWRTANENLKGPVIKKNLKKD